MSGAATAQETGPRAMLVAELVGRLLAGYGVRHVFGVVGSGNFHVTNALVASGAEFVATAHEGGAATMADAYARTCGRVGVLSVHQGPGVTNALTGITEAAKSRTPLLVLAPEATSPRSNFHLDLPGLAAACGAVLHRVSADRVVEDVKAAYARAAAGATVLLALPLEVQRALVSEPGPLLEPGSEPPATGAGAEPAPALTGTSQAEVAALAAALRGAERPVFIAGRGARGARQELIRLAEACDALLAVSAAAKGLFVGDPWYLDVSGGFSTPLAAELIGRADLVVAWGSTLNMWTTRHGRLLAASATVVRVDHDPDAAPTYRPAALTVHGDVATVATAVTELLVGDATAPSPRAGEPTAAPAGGRQRTPQLRRRIAAEGRWRDVPYADTSVCDPAGRPKRIDPRTLTIALDDLLPAARTVVVDSGNFMGYPSMFLSVPDAAGFCFTQAFQSIGLGLSGAIGASVARPDRLTVAALGDGGFLMSAVELVTAVRLGLPLLVVVYDDAAYGAEVHHFGPEGYPLEQVRFPDTDLAAIARGYGCAAVTARGIGDLDAVRHWLAGPRDRPLVVDAKITSDEGAWWLAEAFRGH